MEWAFAGWTASAVVGFIATLAVALLVYHLQRKEQQSLTDLAAKTDGTVAEVKILASKTDDTVAKLEILASKTDGTVAELKKAVDDIDSAVADVAEMLAAQQDQEIEEDISDAGQKVPNEAQPDGERPANEDVYLAALRDRGFIPTTHYWWAKKSRPGGDGRGNLGWFINFDDGRRFFVHHGRKTIVRPAIPRDLLTAWERQTKLNSTEIERDFQIGTGRGNHAWFIRAYSGARWRISRGNGAINVENLDGDPR